MNFLKNKLAGDIAWTMSSLAVLAASGITINVVVAGLRDASALGAFNQAYAIYIISSQVAAFGLQYSVLRYAALYESDAAERERMLVNAGTFALALGVSATVVLYLISPLIGQIFKSPLAAAAMRKSAWGLLLFPLNKLLLAYLNGIRHMKAFSVFQSGRYIIVMLWVGSIAASQLPFETVAYGFLVAELITTCSIVVYLVSRGAMPALRFDPAWTKRHFVFGGKSLLSGIFVELNSRVDVLLVGLFLSDRSVGIYSFAAMMVDGLYHVLAMVRVNYNPVLVAKIRDGDWPGARLLLQQTKRYVLPATGILSLTIVAAFWVLTNYLVPAKGLNDGMLPLCILLVAMTSISVFVPFDNLMLVSGHPGLQTLQHLTLVFSNIILNSLIIPFFGIYGAAFATATSYFIGISVLILMTHRMLRWNLVINSPSSIR